jgi:hypothetical protein
VRRVEGQDPGPAALAAVLAAVVDVPADAGFEHRLGDGGGQEVVLPRLEVAEASGEDGEGALDRRLHDDLPPDDGRVGLGHELSSVVSSAASA